MPPQVKPQQDLLSIREVANDAADRWWKFLDECWSRQDSLILSELWILSDIDDPEVVALSQLVFAKVRQRVDRLLDRWRDFSDVKFEDIAIVTHQSALGQNKETILRALSEQRLCR